MKTSETKSSKIERLILQLLEGARVITASEDVVRVLTPKAVAAIDEPKLFLLAGPINIFIDEDVTPYDLCIALEALTIFLECDLSSEDVWPTADIYSN